MHAGQVLKECSDAHANYLLHNREPQQAPVLLGAKVQGPGAPAAPGTPVDRNAVLFAAALQAVKRKPAL